MKIKKITHNESLSGKRTSEYLAWQGMRERCRNKNLKAYKDYGGRGIKVCDRWLDSFSNFIEDMGERPSKEYSLDRINNDGNYEPTNCKWSTRLEQQNNTRKNKFVTIDGVTNSLSQWGRIYKINKNTICYRVKNGWDIVEAIQTKKSNHDSYILNTENGIYYTNLSKACRSIGLPRSTVWKWLHIAPHDNKSPFILV